MKFHNSKFALAGNTGQVVPLLCQVVQCFSDLPMTVKNVPPIQLKLSDFWPDAMLSTEPKALSETCNWSLSTI
uniref:Uncharacterized protein n=1 Tax=Arundo donax TaxID=35708 RepID=A0A0A9EC77_ARUDO